MGKNLQSKNNAALALAALGAAKTTGAAGGITEIGDLAGVATTLGVPGSAGAHIGTAFKFASQSAPLAVTLEDGTYAGQKMSICQLQGAANAITVADSTGTVLVLTTAAAVDSSGELVWNGTRWRNSQFGAGATSA